MPCRSHNGRSRGQISPQLRRSANSLVSPCCFARLGLLCGEAIEQAVAAGSDEVRLAAAPRYVRGVPGGVAAAGSIVMAEHGDADCAARPVVAGEIQILRPSLAVRGRT